MRLAEAQVFLANGHFAGAYYLAGYAVECALKACIAKDVQKYDFPDLKRAQSSWKHDLTELITTAGLQIELKNAMQQDNELDGNWNTVKVWKESSRYDPTIPEYKASAIVSAIADPAHGVLAWLSHHW
jgi:HEPN domain-containing protein